MQLPGLLYEAVQVCGTRSGGRGAGASSQGSAKTASSVAEVSAATALAATLLTLRLTRFRLASAALHLVASCKAAKARRKWANHKAVWCVSVSVSVCVRAVKSPALPYPALPSAP